MQELQNALSKKLNEEDKHEREKAELQKLRQIQTNYNENPPSVSEPITIKPPLSGKKGRDVLLKDMHRLLLILILYMNIFLQSNSKYLH